MKRIKKLLCIILAALLLLTTGAFAVSAEEPEQPDMEALHQKFTKYLDEQGVEHKLGGEETSSVAFVTETNNWTVFYGTAGCADMILTSDRIENYVFMHGSWENPYKLGLYAESDGKILDLKKACDTGELDINKVADSSSEYIEVYAPGDTDMNGDILVKDVLNVQKLIGKIVEITPENSEFNLYDYDGNGEINLEDVLGMQKFISKWDIHYTL